MANLNNGLEVVFHDNGKLHAINCNPKDFSDVLVLLDAHGLGSDVPDVREALARIETTIAVIKEKVMSNADTLQALKIDLQEVKDSNARQEARIEALLNEKQAVIDALQAANTALVESNTAKDAHIAEQDTNIAALQAAIADAQSKAVDPALLEEVDATAKDISAEQEAYRNTPAPEPVPVPAPEPVV